MKVRVLFTKEEPSLMRRFIGQVFRRPAPAIPVHRSEVPYWQLRGWRQQGRTYRGTYQTAYGSFIGRIDEVSRGNFRLYIYAPPDELKRHSHWSCFQPQFDNSFRVHMSQMPADVSSGILTIERLIAEAYE
jgi:hypothetical protein